MQNYLQNSKNQPLKSYEIMRKILQDALLKAKKYGATDAMVSMNHHCGYSLDVRMGQVDTVAFSEDKGLAITVYFDHQKGSASSTDLSPKGIESMVSMACEIAKVSAVDLCYGLADSSLICKTNLELDLYHPWFITPEQGIEMALDCESMARNMDARISNSDGVNLSNYVFANAMASSQGFEGFVKSSRHAMSCSLIATDKALMQSDYEYTTARHPDDLMSLEHLASGAVARVTKRLNARKIKTQKTAVIFSSRVANQLFGALIDAISGSSLYRKQSFLLDALGTQIFPKFVQVYEQPHILRGLGSSVFDGEGVATRNNIFVKDGCLQSYVLGSYSARRLGLNTTANSGGVFNLTINATHKDLDDLCKTMDKGLLVTDLMGSGTNVLTGDYSQGATGFWVEQGVIQHPVEEITIAGNLKDMFQSIVGIAADINPSYSTRCGSVLLESMMVAGI